MNLNRKYQVILAPLVSEKASIVAETNNQVVFKVEKSATKLEVKKAVEALFNVKVKNVRTINVKGKTKRFGRMEGKRNDWKKAYVSLQPGHEIDLMNIA